MKNELKFFFRYLTVAVLLFFVSIGIQFRHEWSIWNIIYGIGLALAFLFFDWKEKREKEKKEKSEQKKIS
jgi:fatty acid desaturase